MIDSEKCITIAVTGSIAAYRTCEIVRNLKKAGYPVRVIMTKNALNFIGKATFEALTEKLVLVDEYESYMAHIEVKRLASVFAIVPATANIIGKMANGISDDLVSSTYLAIQCPVVVAPAMNPGMYLSKPVQRNIIQLKNDGVEIIDPLEGKVVCGDEGNGKLADNSIIESRLIEIHMSYKS